jgi:heat shock protein HtpX
MANTLKTTLLLGLLTGLILWFGGYVGGQSGMMIAFLFALLMNFGAYWFSDKIVLAMYRAREVDPQQAPGLYRMVERLAQRGGLPTPRVFVIPSDSPNAFATGRNPQHAVVAVTQGILKTLRDEELEGVLAHELAHVKNRDILISSIAATLAGAVMMLASMARWAAIFGGVGGGRDDDNRGGVFGLIFMAVLAPIAAMMIQFAISRTREFEADATGAQIAGNPLGLANALEKLGLATQRIPLQANPATSHLFIVNPLSGKSILKLLSTHPPLEERIRRLRGSV